MNLKALFILSLVFVFSVSAQTKAGFADNDNNIEWAGLEHDTFQTFYRSPFGAVETGSIVRLRFRTFKNDVTAVYLRVYEYNPPTDSTQGPIDTPLTLDSTDATYDNWILEYQTPAAPKIIYYKFRVVDGTDTDFYSDAYFDDHDNLGQGGIGAASDSEPFPSFQLTVYDSNFETPAWIKGAAVYHIFPDRFRNGDITNDWCRSGNTTGCPSLYGAPTTDNIIQTTWNTQMVDPRGTGNNNAFGSQFYGGDLKGIEDKLDYIKNLGFDTIYLNPVFKARSNHRYDTDDYFSVADELGGDAAFTSLSAAANSRGMKIILDGVFNHMSQDSEFFDYFQRSPTVGACEDLSSVYRSWFNFFNNDAPCDFTDYEGWFGFGGLPVLNDNLPAVRDFFYRTPTTNVTQYWYERGANGWRFDVATDLPHDWWNEYRGFAKTYKPDGVLIGEIFPDASQYLAGDQLDGVMNYRFRKNVLGFARAVDWSDNDNNGNNRIVGLTPALFDIAMKSIREDYPLPAQYSMLNLLASHDTNRPLYSLTIAGDSGLTEAKERLKLAAIFQFTYIGAPMVYYGDEAGINAPSLATNGSGLAEDDPYNRAPYPWSDETGNQNVYGPADSDLLTFYTKLGMIRKEYSALQTGNFQTLLTGDTTVSSSDNNTFAFVRSDNSNTAIIVLNNGSNGNTASIPVTGFFPDGSRLKDQLNGLAYTVSGGLLNVNLAARTGQIITAASDSTKFDFDGDSKADISIFRPGPAEWWLLRSSDGGNNAFQFGQTTDTTVPADFTGDGKADIAIWRETTGEWFVLRSEDQSFFSFPFGSPGDIPAPGDYDGDGKADPAVFRPASATWFILRSSDSQVDFVPFGATGDKPLVGDYDNDGKDDVAIYRPSVSQYWINRSNLGVVAFQFGQTGDQALTADFTGDGTSDVGFFRPGTGEWFVIRSEDQSFFAFPFGATGDIPAPGDYDGDGTADATVFRPATNTWFSFQSTAGTVITGFGASGDVPVPSAYVVD